MKPLSILAFAFMMIPQTYTSAQQERAALSWNVAGQVPPLPGQSAVFGYAGPVAGISGSKMLLAGGANFPDGLPWEGGKKKYYDAVFVLEKKGNRIRPLDKLFTLPEPVAYAAVCTTPMGIFYAGGENEKGISRKAYLLNWDETHKNILSIPLPDFPYPVTNASAAPIAKQVFVAGGEKGTEVSDQLWVLDLENTAAGWKELARLPQPVSHAVLASSHLAKEPVLYLAGGRKKNEKGSSDFYSTFYCYPTESRQWKTLAPLPYGLSAGTGMAFPDGSFYLFGGDKGIVFREVESLIAAAAAETNPAKKQELVNRKNELQRNHPGFSHEILRYDPVALHWQATGAIPFATPVTTTAFCWKQHVILPTGEIKAGVRTPDILSVKIPRHHR